MAVLLAATVLPTVTEAAPALAGQHFARAAHLARNPKLGANGHNSDVVMRRRRGLINIGSEGIQILPQTPVDQPTAISELPAAITAAPVVKVAATAAARKTSFIPNKTTSKKNPKKSKATTKPSINGFAGGVSGSYYPDWSGDSFPPESIDWSKFNLIYFGESLYISLVDTG